MHHFAHYALEKCDNWREGMTHWHAQWQKIVLDKTNLEVCLDLNGQILGYSAFQGQGGVIVAAQAETHIADIIRPSSQSRPLVIEVQHSSISKDKIESRERYYQQMIWLFDFTPRMVTQEKCNRIVFVDGKISYLKDKVTFIAMISCSQSVQQNTVRTQIIKTFDQIELISSNNNDNNSTNPRPDLSLSTVTGTPSNMIYCKGDECESEALVPISGFFMIVASRTKYWLDTTKPTYFDCGFGIMRLLIKLNQSFMLVQYFSYEDFIRERMPPINVDKYNNADWFKTISPAVLIKLGIIPRIIDVARIQICKNRVIINHKGLELQDMGLEQGMDDWHGGSFYANQNSNINTPSVTIVNPLANDSSNDLMSRLLRQATSSAVSFGGSNAANIEAMIIVKIRRFLGISTAVEIKSVNRKGGEWVLIYCNNETYNLKDKFKTLEMTYHRAAADKVSNRQSMKNTHSVIQSVVNNVSSGKAIKPPAPKNELYDEETRAHYRGKLKKLEIKLANMGL